VADARYPQVAAALADELDASLAAGGRGAGRRSMRVTTLVDRFGAYRLTPTVRSEIAGALDAAGIDLDPSLDHTELSSIIRLSRRSRPAVPVEDAVHESLWPLDSSMVRRIDVDAEGIDPDALHVHLREICGPELSLRTVERLLTANPQLAHDYVHEEPDVAFAFRVRAFEPDDDATADDDPMAPKAGVIDFQTVAITADDDWVIIVWHSPTRATGAGEALAQDHWEKHGFEPGVKARWLTDLTTGDEIALGFMGELLDTVATARRSMFSWLEAWEIDFSRRLQQTETGTLLRIRGLVAELRARMTLVAREPFLSRDDDPRRAALANSVEHSLRLLRELSEMVRGASEMVATSTAQKQEERSERLQNVGTLVASVFLVPTLIGTIYGANTNLPGRDTWTGFAVMLVVMVGSGAATYAIISWLQRRSG
jgi:hypothetical protein